MGWQVFLLVGIAVYLMIGVGLLVWQWPGSIWTTVGCGLRYDAPFLHLRRADVNTATSIKDIRAARRRAVQSCVLHVLAWPVLGIMEIRERHEWKRLVRGELAPPLRFSAVSGSGDLHCRQCGAISPIVGCIHGHARPAWYICSYQCRACNRLVNVRRVEGERVELPRCECGGELSRDDLVRCPACGSGSVFCGWGGIVT